MKYLRQAFYAAALTLVIVPAALAQNVVFPQFVIGGGYVATVYVTNATNSAMKFGLDAYIGNGERWPYEFTVKGTGGVYSGLAGFSGTIPAQATWKFEVSGDPYNTRVGYIVSAPYPADNWDVGFNLMYQNWL